MKAAEMAKVKKLNKRKAPRMVRWMMWLPRGLVRSDMTGIDRAILEER
jgi:hypothetical protein